MFVSQILIGTFGTGTLISLFTIHFLYQVTQCHAEFVIHSEGIALHAETLVDLHRAVAAQNGFQIYGKSAHGTESVCRIQ